MSYFATAEEMSENLRVPLLLRVEADPRFLQRHDRVSRFAAEMTLAGRFYHRLQKIVEQILPEQDLIGQIVWVTGPWGSLEHLPWAIGLADQTARLGWTALLSEREPGGTLRSLFPQSGTLPVLSLPDAERVLGSPLIAAATDLEGVRLLFPTQRQETAEGRPPQTLRRWCLILADSLPESLEGPYPGGRDVLGVVLVASFRDHTAWSLHAAVDGLREAGNQILGLVAIGPEATLEPLERMSERAAPMAPPLRPAPALRDVPAPSRAIPIEGPQAPREAEPPEPAEPAPARFEASVVIRESRPPAPRPLARPSPVAPPPAEARPAPEGVVPPMTPPPEPVPPPQPVQETKAVPLFSAWQTTRVRKARAQRAASIVALILLTAVFCGIIYLRFLRQRFARPELPGQSAPAEPLLSVGADSARKATERIGQIEPTRGESTAAGALSMGPATAVPKPGSRADSAAVGQIPPDSSASRRVRPEALNPASIPRDTLPTRPAPPDSLARSGIIPDTLVFPAAAEDTVPAASTGEKAAALAGEEERGERERPISPAPDSFVVHLSSFRLLTEAEMEVGRFHGQGIEARYLRVPVSGQGTWYRVITGRFGTFAEAESVALRLLAAGKISGAHVVPGGGWGAPVPIGGTEPMR